MSETNGTVVSVDVAVETPVVPSPVTTWDTAAVVAVHPWFAELPVPMQEAARAQWVEASADDATLLPTDGMEDRGGYEKALEAWVKSRDTVMSEAEVEACDADYEATIKAAVKTSESVASDKLRLAVLCHHALRVRLAPNPARKGPKYKRGDVLGEMVHDMRDTIDSVTEVADYVRYGACAATLFGATKATPIIGRDGIVRSKLTNGVKAMPWTIITALSPLVVKSGSNEVETWTVLTHVADGVRELVDSIKADAKMPRATIANAVEALRLANAKAEVQRNPHNKAAAAEVTKLETKLADKAVEVDASTPVTVEVSTPATPASLITVEADGEDAGRTDAEADAFDMHEVLTTSANSVATWVAFLETCKDDADMDADIKSDCIAMLLRRSNRNANADKEAAK